jgi:16S rRNA (uracil1498-N3)-methyltransferase
VGEIIPLLCEHTERQHTRQDRLQSILISALLQSQQSWLPVLREPALFTQFIASAHYDRRLIAHCLEVPRPNLAAAPTPTQLILIGPEGDFSPKEVEAAIIKEFVPVTLGANRLRTETAGVVAATLLCIG